MNPVVPSPSPSSPSSSSPSDSSVHPNQPSGKFSKSLPNPMEVAQSPLPDTLLHAVTLTPAHSEALTTSQMKTMSSTASILNQSITGVCHLVDRGISKAMTGLCRGTENVLFISSMMRNDYAVNLAKLKVMTGDGNLGDFLSQYADHVASTIPSTLFDEGSYMNQTMEGEAVFLKQFVESMVLKVAVNVGKRLRQEGKEVSLMTITSGVVTLMAEVMESSREAFAEALQIESPKARELAMRNAALPIVDALLHLAFPKGAAELPVRWGAHYFVWRQLRETFLQRVIPLQHLVQTISDTESDSAQHLFLMKKIEDAGTLAEKEGSRFLSDPVNAASFAQKVLEVTHVGQGDAKGEKLKDWLTDQIQQFGNRKNPTGAMLWKLFGGGGTAAFSYMASHLLKSSDGNGGDIFSAVFQLLDKVSAFDKQHQKAIQACRLKLQAEGKDPEKCPEYLECFKPLAAALEESFGLSTLKAWIAKIVGESAIGPGDEIFLQNLAHAYDTDVLPAIQLYRALNGTAEEEAALLSPMNGSLISAKQRLHQQLILPRNGVAICSVEDAEIVSEQIGNLCGVISQHAAPIIQKNINEEIRRQLGAVPDRLSNPKAVEVQCRYLQKVIQSSMMQMLVNYLQEETVDQAVLINSENKVPGLSGASLSQLLRKIAQTLEKQLTENAEKIQAAALVSEDPEEKQKALREAFQPLAKALAHLVVPRLSATEGFPLDIPFKGALQLSWSSIQDTILPDLLASMYVDTTLWKRTEAAARDTIAAEIKTPYVPEACRVLAGWVHDFTPVYVCANRKELSEGIYNGVAQYLAQSGSPEGMSVSQYIQENEDAIKKHLCEDMLSCIPPDGPLVKATRPLTSQYMESFMLKLCSNLASKINDAQGRTPKDQEMFMVNLGLHLLQAFNQHFSKVNAVTGSQKRYAAHLVSHDEFVVGFEDKLHPGIPQTAEGLQARRRINEALTVIDKERRLSQRVQDPVKQEQSRKKIKAAQATIRVAKAKQAEERQKFFQPFAESLIELSGFKGPQDLAVPENMQKATWEAFTTSILPSMAESIFEVMARPETRVKMVISGLETLNQAMDSIKPETEQPEVVDDALQKKLNKACGELVLQLVQLVPHSMVQTAFKIDKFKILEKQSAEIVGKAVRNYLGKDLNLFTLMDQGVQSSLQVLYPGGQWKPDSRGMLRFEPDKSKIKPVDLSQFTDEALEQQERENLLQSDREMQQMRRMMVKTTRRVMSESIMSGFTLPFLKIKQMWETCVAKCALPENVRQFFRRVGDLLIFRMLEVFLSFCSRHVGKAAKVGKEVLSFVSNPFREAFWFFMEIHLGRKADDVIKSLQLEIHENLLYQLTDVLMTSLTAKTPFAESDTQLIEPLVLAAERRGWLEKEQLLEDIKRLGLHIAGMAGL